MPDTRERLLLLVTLDTTRADRLGAWGGPAKTPNLDRLAAAGLRFSRCEASSPLTLPSHSTILTGLEPPQHGVRDNGPWCLAPRHETVAETLSAAGWTTAAVVSAAVLARARGLDQGFGRYLDDLAGGTGSVPERTADATTDLALAQLAILAGDGAPSFLWVHYFDPHFPYRPPGGTPARDPHAAYDAELAFLDGHLGRLLDALPADAAVVVVGDHGEMLGDGGEPRHGILPGDGVRHVPLIVRAPGVVPDTASDTVPDLVRTADVAPTLLQLAGLEPLAGEHSRSVLELVDGVPDTHRPTHRLAYWETFFPHFAYGWSPLRAVSDGERIQVRTLAEGGAVGGDVEGDLDQQLDRFLASAGESAATLPSPSCSLSAEDRLALEALGYAADTVSGSGPESLSSSLPDPRLRIETAVFLQQAAARVPRCGSGQDDPMERLAAIVADDPGNPTARELTARCRLARGEPQSALALLKEPAIAARPVLLTLLGDVHLALDRTEAARAAWRRALVLDPAEARAAVQLARSLRSAGDAQGAERVVESLADAGGATAEAIFERAMARVALAHHDAALGDFLDASRRAAPGPLRVAPLLNAADLAERLGRTAQARDALAELVRLLPRRADLWLRLGDAEERVGHLDAARAAYRNAVQHAADDPQRRDAAARLLRLEPR